MTGGTSRLEQVHPGRITYYGGTESWNLRDKHMFETLGHPLEAHGTGSKAVVWAYNSDIGDAPDGVHSKSPLRV